jgi:hypothetical protein
LIQEVFQTPLLHAPKNEPETDIFDETKPVNLSNVKTGLAWINQRRGHFLFVVLLMISAGMASVFGLLRW